MEAWNHPTGKTPKKPENLSNQTLGVSFEKLLQSLKTAQNPNNPILLQFSNSNNKRQELDRHLNRLRLKKKRLARLREEEEADEEEQDIIKKLKLLEEEFNQKLEDKKKKEKEHMMREITARHELNLLRQSVAELNKAIKKDFGMGSSPRFEIKNDKGDKKPNF